MSRPGAAISPDERASLEDQRDFLLSSLEDLEREHAAGDVDDHDYAELRDDYTARAARVIRAIEAHEVQAPEGQSQSSTARRVLVAAGIAAFVVLAGVLVALQARDREPGETATGSIRESASGGVDQLLADAHGLAAERQLGEAVVAYDQVLEVDPDNVEAMTYKGWMQLQSGDQQGVVTLVEAAELDPEYPDVKLFLAIAFVELGRDDSALELLDRLAELDPPPEIADAAADLRAEIESRQATPPTSTGG
ncbi:MAG: tetratricopeptide repeat protein [Acidimicrobiales bacterium]